MRRWTLLVVPHDSEAPRSYAVTDRALRVAGIGVVGLLLVSMVGVGTIVARLGRVRGPQAPKVVVATLPGPSDSTAILLEGRVDSLRLVVDSIAALDDSLSRATGALRTADTLLGRARSVNARMRALDSVARSVSAPR